MRPTDRWARIAAATLLTAIQVPVIIKTAADPAQSDFANYFTPARVLATRGDVGALYDRDGFERALAKTGIETVGSFVPHPPANALWLLPFTGFTPAAAKALWTMILLAALSLCIAEAYHLLGRDGPLAVICVMAPTLAIRNGLAFGQPYVILAAFLLAGTLALERGREFGGGFLLGLGVSFKPYALGIGPLLLGRERRRSLAGFGCGVLLPSALLFCLAGPAPFREFFAKVLPWMLRGEIQDPFSASWGSASALAHRLFRFESDLNPDPWIDAPRLAAFVGTSVCVLLLVLGVLAGKRAIGSGRSLDSVAATIGFALAASPFAATYHFILLVVPAVAVAVRVRGRVLGWWLIAWAVLGSPLIHLTRSASGLFAPFAYVRFPGVIAFALAAAWPFLDRRMVHAAAAAGIVAGSVSLVWVRPAESWPRVEAARGYSMSRPYFCGASLRWWSPSADGRRIESRGEGADCAPSRTSERVVSRFAEGSWDLYLIQGLDPGAEVRLTHSTANEIDPVMAPDGCHVVFASDQGRGLGSTALYRIDLSGVIARCGKVEPDAPRR